MLKLPILKKSALNRKFLRCNLSTHSVIYRAFQKNKYSQVKTQSIKLILGIFLIFSTTTGCLVYDASTGPTPADMQREFLQGFVVRGLQRYFPSGTSKDFDSPVEPNERNFKEAQFELSSFVDYVKKTHRSRHQIISSIFQTEIAPNIVVNAELVPQGIVAHSKETGETRVSFSVLRGIFRGAILEDLIRKEAEKVVADRLPKNSLASTLNALGMDDTVKKVYDDYYNPQFQPGAATELQRQSIQRLIESVEEARSTRALGGIGIGLSAIFGNRSESTADPVYTFWRLTNYSHRLSQVYNGAVMFLVAHEQSHLAFDDHRVLGKLLSTGDDRYCERKREAELRADAYALMITSTSLAERRTDDGATIYHQFPVEQSGWRAFLKYSTDLSGFERGHACTYPSNEDRFNRLLKIETELVNAANDGIEENIDRVQAVIFTDKLNVTKK